MVCMHLYELVFSLDMYPGVELLAHMIYFQFFEEPQYCFLQRLHKFIFSPTVYRGSLFSTSLPTFVIYGLFFFFFKFILFIYYFWLHWVFFATRGLSLVTASGGYSLLCVGFSLQWLVLLRSTGSRHAGFSSCGTRASVVVARGLQSAGSVVVAQQLWHSGLVALRHVGCSWTRARARVACIGRQILNHCATREAPSVVFLMIAILTSVRCYLIVFSVFFLTSLLEYNCFTVLCQFLLYNKMNQLYVYVYPHICFLLHLPPTLLIPPLQVVVKH